jgi:acetyl esterase/lipase
MPAASGPRHNTPSSTDARVMRSLLTSAALFLLTGASYAQAQPGPIVYRVDGMESVQVTPDQVYKTVDDVELQFDSYLPAGEPPATGWPTVVLMHGGPIGPKVRPKDWPLYQSYGRVLAASGLAAIIPNFRFPNMGAWPDAAADGADLLKHVRAKTADLRIDPDALGLWVFSGGGPQLSLALQSPLPYVRCLISFYAFLDMPPQLAAQSPLAHLRAYPGKTPPMFIARMGKDIAMLNRTVDAFIEQARTDGQPIEVADYPEGVHAFDVDLDTDESREIIARAIAFAKQHLAPADVKGRSVDEPQTTPRSPGDAQAD